MRRYCLYATSLRGRYRFWCQETKNEIKFFHEPQYEYSLFHFKQKYINSHIKFSLFKCIKVYIGWAHTFNKESKQKI